MRPATLAALLACAAALPGTALAQQDAPGALAAADALLRAGQYAEAVGAYDAVLEERPGSVHALVMRGIALSNSGDHRGSLGSFFAAVQLDPGRPVALAGMGAGFGNLGEYRESSRYFEAALALDPGSTVAANYAEFVAGVVSKYPYTPTERPAAGQGRAPAWLADAAGWWASGRITDAEFLGCIGYLAGGGALVLPAAGLAPGHAEPGGVPGWIRDAAGSWAAGGASDAEFLEAAAWVAGGGPSGRTQADLDSERLIFERYLAAIAANIEEERRYIEPPNPSPEVIKKFLRDQARWNFEEQIRREPGSFADPEVAESDGGHVIRHTVFVNDQPTGLPLDHVGTLRESLAFWESQELDGGGGTVSVEFETTDLRHEASVWVTWVVRDIGEGVLGHANVGKGVVEVALGDYGCDGSFQLYDVESVKYVMTHELGHSIGLGHSDDESSVMYPSYSPSYAYCLLG